MRSIKVFNRTIDASKVVPALQKILEDAESIDGQFLFFGKKYSEKPGHNETHNETTYRELQYKHSDSGSGEGHYDHQRDSPEVVKERRTVSSHSDYTEGSHHTDSNR